MDDLISRSAAIDAAIEAVDEWDGGYSLSRADMIDKAINNLPSAQPEHLVKESGNLVKGLVNDCIRRQAAIDAVNGMPDCPNGYSDTYGKGHIIAVLEDVPSVQPEIIRCKDCKYWMRAYLSISGKHGCNVMRDYTAPDDYCFKAERKA